MNRLHFIYQPKSGSRFIGAACPRSEANGQPMLTPAVRWSNGCAHVYGTGLAWPTDSRALREELAELAMALACEAGGVAYDEQGTIGLIVPRLLARIVAEAMDSVVQLRHNGIAATPDERAYEIDGWAAWTSRVRQQRSYWIGGNHCRWIATRTCEPGPPEVYDEGTVDGPDRTLIVWERIEPLTRVEVRAPWQEAEMYPEPVVAPSRCEDCAHWRDNHGCTQGLPGLDDCESHLLAAVDGGPITMGAEVRLADHVTASDRYASQTDGV